MTPSDIARIRLSFAVLSHDPEGFATDFYAKLFALAPEVAPLFTSDMSEQGRKLVAMLALVVRSLDHLEAIMPALQSLGRRHATYGVRTAHYDHVGAALLATMASRLGTSFNAEVHASWATAYGVLAGAMIEAAADQAV